MSTPSPEIVEAVARASNFKPVKSLADLETLDAAEIIDGYSSAEAGDPEPGTNRGRAYWHGWCNWQRDHGNLPATPESAALAHEFVKAAAAKDKTL